MHYWKCGPQAEEFSPTTSIADALEFAHHIIDGNPFPLELVINYSREWVVVHLQVFNGARHVPLPYTHQQMQREKDAEAITRAVLALKGIQ